MKEIISIIGLIYIIETKSIRSIIYLIIIIIQIAIYLITIKLEYISYILIIIYISALTILFIFVIMLISKTEKPFKIINYYNTNSNSPGEFNSPISGSLGLDIKTIIIYSIIFISLIAFIINFSPDHYMASFEENNTILYSDKNIMKMIGLNLYENPNMIINLIIVTFILFLALIGILFLIN